MSLHLERKDYYVVLAALVISVLSGFMMEYFQGSALISIHDATFYLPGPVLLFGLVMVYLGRDRYGGQVGRNLEIIGVGVGSLGVLWLAWANYFAAGFPSWGVTPAFWSTLLSLGILAMFLVTTYGFYLFWKLGTEEVGDEE